LMKILITGSSGLVGRALVESLHRDGHAIGRLLRPQSPREASDGGHGIAMRWNPATGELDDAAAGADAVVNLAGASVASGRWTEERKNQLRSSRIDSTRKLIGALAKLKPMPRIFISASAVGYYGDRGDEELTETSVPGRGFLADLCRKWESEATRAESLGMRVAGMRFGTILAGHGGALQRMLPPFKLGAGGRLGSGNQWMSWISLADVLGAVRYMLENQSARGPVNAVAPRPVRNHDLTAALARVLHRPAILPVPAFALRMAFGEMADALLLTSQRVLPQKLQTLGYRFAHPELPAALAAALNTT
jgi:uncharacterized protein (TIGR01777 family)